jgi:protein-S-isoprenylcysteine O-methyltransferase Ste14
MALCDLALKTDAGARPPATPQAPHRPSRRPEATKLHSIRIRPATLDQAERLIFVVIYFFFAVRMVRGYLTDGQVLQLLYLLDQFIVLVFFICRRRSEVITTKPMDWVVGFVGSCIPLLIGPISPDAALTPLPVAAFLGLFGMIIHLLAKLTLRRSFGAVAANRGIKASGPYRYIRHPMYLGYILSQSGLLFAGPNLRNLVVVVLCWLFFLWRIEAEERLLAEDATYRTFMTNTRFRLFPGLF